MKLALSFDGDWEIKTTAVGQSVAVLPSLGKIPDVIVTYGSLTLLPDEQKTWVEQIVRSDLPTGTTVKIVQSIEGNTDSGWPLRLVEVEVFAPKSEKLQECRLCAFYAFLEHGAALVARTGDRSTFESQRTRIECLLRSGRPDWKRAGQPACLYDFWNVAIDREAVLAERTSEVPPAAGAPADLAASSQEPERIRMLAEVDAAITEAPTPALYVARGTLCSLLSRFDEAVIAYREAIARGDQRAEPQRLLGAALGRLGRNEEATAAWKAALVADPTDVESLYNLAQVQYNQREFANALENWNRVFALDPQDFLTLRKVVQAQYALGQAQEAEKTRARLLAQWRTSDDPRARLLHEYVLDQFQVGSYTVHAFETVRPKNPAFYAIYSFRLFDAHGHTVPFEVVVETSEYSRQAGVPYVLGMKRQGKFKGLGTSSQLPSYTDLKATVQKLITEATLLPHSHTDKKHQH